MFYMEGPCPICGTGTRGFRLCSDNVLVVGICDECEATWLDAERVDASDAVYVAPPEYLVSGRSCSIAAPSSRWATLSEKLSPSPGVALVYPTLATARDDRRGPNAGRVAVAR